MCQRQKRPFILSNEKCKNQHLWWYGGASVSMAWVIYMYVCKGTINAEAFLVYVLILESHMMPSRRWLFQGTPCRTMPGLILQELQQRGFVGIECVCLTGLPAVQICLLLKMYGASWRGESDNRRPLTVEQLKCCIHQEWAKIPLAKLQQLISSVPKRLQSVIKRKGDVTQMVSIPRPHLFLSVLQVSLSKFVYIYQIKLSSVKTLKIFSLSFCLLNKGSSEWTYYRFLVAVSQLLWKCTFSV